MNEKIIAKIFSLSVVTMGMCLVSCLAEQTDSNSMAKPQVEMVLELLNKRTAELKSYQSRIEYKFSQPILESETLRKGVLYYQKSDGKLAGAKPGAARSALRMDFQTLKQDEEQEQKYIEQYIFDGVWLTHIDYQIKEVKRYQKAEPNEPVDAFELASENFPIIGFSKVEDLKKEFEIGLVDSTSSPQVEQKPSVIPAQPVPSGVEGAGIQDFIQLHLKVKADSIYKNDYKSIDFWIDKQLYLPAKIVAVSTEEDIYEIKFLQPKVNKKIDKKVFELEIPKGFAMEVIPLKEKTNSK